MQHAMLLILLFFQPDESESFFMCIIIRIKKNDQVGGKRLERVLIYFLMGAKISGATVWTGVDGFGKRKRATVQLEGISSICQW
jgi:PII-like signaling protein